ncbi:unnamed protein product [Dibothriocephalus latus]|uniref:Uncharacterized protein n=1 Tax=Dibothriocephalus latus TaxID=60516 RepID=A0A3P7P1J1_DIBLA|nr:unnamed protein product [Dibothriocephalus latus]
MNANGLPVRRQSNHFTYRSDYARVASRLVPHEGWNVSSGEALSLRRPSITIGSCLDPSTRRAQQSLNGDLAGVQLLLGQNEDHSVSRCLSQCGETLLLPKANEVSRTFFYQD